MEFWFLPQLIGFFASLVLLNSWINRFLLSCYHFDSKYLPCFSWGWCVYLLIYLLGRQWAISTETIHWIFTGMAVGIPCLTGVWYGLGLSPMRLQKRYHGLPLEKETLFLVSLFVGGMIYIGPYLEFPSDPVYHLFFIQNWEAAQWMTSVEGRPSHFVYFLYHWLLEPSNISWGQRTGLAILSAGLQGLLLWNFIRVTRIFIPNVWVGWFGGVASVGLFGNSIFSFYRYYVLSNGFISYLVFLEGLILIFCCFFKERFRYLLLLIPLLVFCLFNHRQEGLLLLNAVVGIGFLSLIFRYRTLSARFRRPLLFVAGIGTVVAILLWSYLSKPLLTESQLFYLKKIADGLLERPLYVSSFVRLNEVLGGAGWLAMVAALVVLLWFRHSKKLTILACLCLWPLIVLWNPIAVELMLNFFYSTVLYRLIYGSLYWIFLVVFFGYLYQQWHHSPRARSGHWKLAIGMSVFIAVMWIPQAPIKGKIQHLLTKPSDQLNGKNLDAAIQYLRRQAPENCTDPYRSGHRPVRTYLFSDNYVNSYLLATGYFYTISDRWEPISYGSAYPDFMDRETVRWLETLEEKDAPLFYDKLKTHHICYVILSSGNPAPPSRTGSLSGHWPAEYANTKRDDFKTLFHWVRKRSQQFQLVFQDQAVRIYKVL